VEMENMAMIKTNILFIKNLLRKGKINKIWQEKLPG
jgi:hypothetical protein